MDIWQMYAYSDLCRKLLFETLQTHPDVFLGQFDTASNYNTICRHILHSGKRYEDL